MQDFMCQRVGIYYKDINWALGVFNQYLGDYAKLHNLERYTCSLNDMAITFKDGSCIRFLPVDEDIRGYRFDKIIMEPGIKKELVETHIRPYLLPYWNRPRVLREDGTLSWI